MADSYTLWNGFRIRLADNGDGSYSIAAYNVASAAVP